MVQYKTPSLDRKKTTAKLLTRLQFLKQYLHLFPEGVKCVEKSPRYPDREFGDGYGMPASAIVVKTG